MMERVLVDTGPLVAISSQRDQYHKACTDVLRRLDPPMLTCWPVLTEAAWLLRRSPVSVQRLLASFEAGLLRLLPQDHTALPQIAGTLRRYENLGAQLADACLIQLAERHGLTTVFTLDRRDFEVYRLSGNRKFRLIPN